MQGTRGAGGLGVGGWGLNAIKTTKLAFFLSSFLSQRLPIVSVSSSLSLYNCLCLVYFFLSPSFVFFSFFSFFLSLSFFQLLPYLFVFSILSLPIILINLFSLASFSLFYLNFFFSFFSFSLSICLPNIIIHFFLSSFFLLYFSLSLSLSLSTSTSTSFHLIFWRSLKRNWKTLKTLFRAIIYRRRRCCFCIFAKKLNLTF